jgi:hypothetical protein
MPRTASTFFQRELFPLIDGFSCIGPEITQYSTNFQKLLYQDDTLWDGAEFAAAFTKNQSNNLIISNELFAGQSLYLAGTNRSRNAQRLSVAFPDAEILLVLRNQTDLLQSLYAIGVYSGHSMSASEFIRFSDNSSSAKSPLYPTFAAAEITEIYNYVPLIKLYRSLFSTVHVVLYENFAAEPKVFTDRLLASLGLSLNQEISFSKKTNRSLSARQIYFLRILNRWKPLVNRGKLGRALFRMKLRFIERRLSGGMAFKFDREFREKIKTHFAEANAELAALLPELAESKVFRDNYSG